MDTGEGEIFKLGLAAMLARDDVIDLGTVLGKTLRAIGSIHSGLPLAPKPSG